MSVNYSIGVAYKNCDLMNKEQFDKYTSDIGTKIIEAMDLMEDLEYVKVYKAVIDE